MLELPEELLELTEPIVVEFIMAHLQTSVEKLALKPQKIGTAAFRNIIAQIAARQKLLSKFPEWAHNPALLFPPSMNLEQSSSAFCAQAKFQHLNHLNKAADLTGGFGIDTYFLSKVALEVDYVEPNSLLASIVKWNFSKLGIQHVHFHNTSSEQFIQDCDSDYNLFYIDPSRRNESGKRSYNLADYEPNILNITPILLTKAKEVIVKTSPMISINQVMTELPQIATIQLVEYENELKEINLTLHQVEAKKHIVISSDKTTHNAETDYDDKFLPVRLPDTISGYLLEPSAVWQKSGLFGYLCNKYKVSQMGLHTHFMVSPKLVPEFVGKQWKIKQELAIDKATIQAAIDGSKANVVLRNAPIETAEFCKKMGLTHGEPHYLLGGKDKNEKFRLFFCERIY